jgi:hypothetical protein
VALNGLKVLVCDIQNAYLMAKCYYEKVLMIAGPEFVSDAGCKMIIVRALCGLKKSGAAFRALLAETLHDMNYVPSKADPEILMQPAAKENGFECYEHVLCYVDDVLYMSGDPLMTMNNGLQSKFKLKGDKIAQPKDYLGAGMSKMQLSDGGWCWEMSPAEHVSASVKNIEDVLAKNGL